MGPSLDRMRSRCFERQSTLFRALRGAGSRAAALVAPVVTGDAVATSPALWQTNYGRLPAPLAALLLVGAAGLGLLLLAASAYCALRGRGGLARRWFVGALGVGVLYAAALLGMSLLSADRALPLGGEKYFCELDCHLAYSVQGVDRLGAAVGVPGTVWTVTVRARFDEATTAPWRPRDVPVWPNPRRAWVEDDAGARHERSAPAEEALPLADDDLSTLDRPLVPGQSYRSRLAFVLPPGRRPVRLLLADGEWFQRLVVDNEATPWHGRVWFELPS